MEIPDSIAAQQAIVKQNVAMSLIKSAAKADQAIIGVLEDSARNIAASNRGGNVNLSV